MKSQPLACRCLLLVLLFSAVTVLQAADNDEKTEKKPPRDRNKIEDITFDDIKLDLAKDEDYDEEKVTERVRELHKQMIRVGGWIHPSFAFQQKGIKEFVLVRDNMECCFGPGAALYDCIIVQMEEGKSAEYTTRPIKVEGMFELRPAKDELTGKHYAIYYMRARRVK